MLLQKEQFIVIYETKILDIPDSVTLYDFEKLQYGKVDLWDDINHGYHLFHQYKRHHGSYGNYVGGI